MKGEWSGGKGSFPRKVDTNKYNSNYDVIFKKNQKNLFLDDQRWPRDVCWMNIDYTSYEWEIVRDFEQFKKALDEKTYDFISFDHDLDRSASYECVLSLSNKTEYNYSKVKERTGRDCAIYLMAKCINEGRDLPKYAVHSLNKQGSANIIDILEEDKLIAYNTSDELAINKSDEILSII